MFQTIVKILCLLVAGVLGLLSWLNIVPVSIALPVITALLSYVFGSEVEKQQKQKDLERFINENNKGC